MPSLPVFRSSPRTDGNTNGPTLTDGQYVRSLSARPKRSVSGTTGRIIGAGNHVRTSGDCEIRKVEVGLAIRSFPVGRRVRPTAMNIKSLHVRDDDDDGDTSDDTSDEEDDENDDDKDKKDAKEDKPRGGLGRGGGTSSTVGRPTATQPTVPPPLPPAGETESTLLSSKTLPTSQPTQTSDIPPTSLSITPSEPISSPTGSQSSGTRTEDASPTVPPLYEVSTTTIVLGTTSSAVATSPATPTGRDTFSNTGFISGIVAGVVILIMILALIFCFFRRRRMRRSQGSSSNYPFVGYGKNRHSAPSSIGFNPIAMVRQRSHRSIHTILSSFKKVRRKPVPVYREEDLTSVSSFSTDTHSSRVFSDDFASSSTSFQEKMPIEEDHTYAVHPAGQDEKDVRESLVEIPMPLVLAPVRSQHLQ